LEKFLYTHADAIAINSPGFLDHVRGRGGQKISVVPNGADPGMFAPLAHGEAFRSAHGLQGKFVVLYAGAHGLSNDLGIVLDAAQLLKREANIAIVLLGDGKDKPKLQEQAAQASLSNVHFVAPAPKAAMAEAVAAADACIAILKPLEMYATVYPNKVFDYMAAGRPVILAIDGVIRQVIEKAGAGVFVPPGNAAALAAAIRGLAADPQSAREMGSAGRATLEQRFDRRKLADEMEAVIAAAVKRSQL
jgi:glycosyltransferase involved in cell wall biosynthesis